MLIAEHLWSIALVTILTSPHFNKLLLNCFICSNVFQRFLSLFVLFGPKINWHKYQICGFLRSNCVFSAQICRKKISPVLREASKDLIKSSAIQTSGRAAATVCSSELSLFDWNYVSSHFVCSELHRNRLDGVEEHLGNVGQSNSLNTTQTAHETNPKWTALCMRLKWIHTKHYLYAS